MSQMMAEAAVIAAHGAGQTEIRAGCFDTAQQQPAFLP